MRTTVVALHRWPVKSMGGERLDAVDLDARGLVGDRWWAVVDEDGRFASGKSTRRFRRRDAVLRYAASTAPGGTVTVRRGDRTWAVDDPALAAALSADEGLPLVLREEGEVPHQDDGAVTVVGSATLAWIADRLGGAPDPRRLRANVVLATDEPFVEETWTGRTLALGTAALTLVEPAPRCRMVDLEVDGSPAPHRWLPGLTDLRDGCAAVYADVASPGRVAVGDRVEVAADG